ncbi:MAG: hypothetical protein JWL72_3660 [Ilumatobacteraceae bacterium]|nr:hypothetical protein [Ilumatobacteraceae bacterium]MCU1390322.1 hypothetical protein [Ilumatobacteraceae bacterium]
MNVVVLVLLILLGVVLIQAAVWIPIIRSWRRKKAQFDATFAAEVVASGERTIVAPEAAVYRGATGTYGAVKGNGTILLTDHRLVFRKKSGGVVDIPVAKITGVSESKAFLRSRVGGMTHLVVATTDPAQVGFFVTDLAAWQRALDGVLAH